MAEVDGHAELLASVQKLTAEIARLSDQQREVLQKAAFVGMTDDEIREYDLRSDQIASLVKKLSPATGGFHEQKKDEV